MIAFATVSLGVLELERISNNTQILPNSKTPSSESKQVNLQ